MISFAVSKYFRKIAFAFLVLLILFKITTQTYADPTAVNSPTGTLPRAVDTVTAYASIAPLSDYDGSYNNVNFSINGSSCDSTGGVLDVSVNDNAIDNTKEFIATCSGLNIQDQQSYTVNFFFDASRSSGGSDYTGTSFTFSLDNVAPTLQSAQITGDDISAILTLHYDESLSSVNVPDPSDFTLSDGTVSAVNFSGSDVMLSLMASVCSNANITVSYTPNEFDMSKHLQDAAGNNVASFLGVSVTNSSTHSCVYCGNGTCDIGEDSGSCPTDCGTSSFCGDGVVDMGESCDDGGNNGYNGYCNSSCTGMTEYCGDGVVSMSETCDDGGNNGNNGYCNSVCSGPTEYCGDNSCNGGEDALSCPTDCAPTDTTPPQFIDGTVNGVNVVLNYDDNVYGSCTASEFHLFDGINNVDLGEASVCSVDGGDLHKINLTFSSNVLNYDDYKISFTRYNTNLADSVGNYIDNLSGSPLSNNTLLAFLNAYTSDDYLHMNFNRTLDTGVTTDPQSIKIYLNEIGGTYCTPSDVSYSGHELILGVTNCLISSTDLVSVEYTGGDWIKDLNGYPIPSFGAESVVNNATGDHISPVVTISNPTSGSYNSAFEPLVNWGDASTCSYSYDNNVFTTLASCDASLIPAPSSDGAWTLYLHGIDSSENTGSASVSFNYDINGPSISSVNASSGDASATVTWSTNEVSSSQVVYGATSSYGSSTSVSDSDTGVNSHSVLVSTLSTCSTYHYAVVSKDLTGNYATSTDSTFTTTGCVTGGGSGGSGGGTSYSGGGTGFTSPFGLVNGAPIASTTVPCGDYITSAIYYGRKNDVSEVTKLQLFLNDSEGEKLAVDGKFKLTDRNAVKRFQNKYKSEILTPLNLKSATGDVGGATRGKINKLHCGASSMTCAYFTQNHKKGDVGGEILNIKSFLNTQGESLNLLTASFDLSLEQAVKRFQQKNSREILSPLGLSLPTGLWYESTRKYANSLLDCGGAPISR